MGKPSSGTGDMLSLRMFVFTVSITRRARVEVFGANAIAGGEDHAAGTYVASNGPTGGNTGLLTKVDISPNAVEDWFTGGSTVAAVELSVAGSMEMSGALNASKKRIGVRISMAVARADRHAISRRFCTSSAT